MPTIPQRIRDAFLAKLAESAIDTNKVDKLRDLMADGKKLKTDDVVKLFLLPHGDGLK